MVASVLAEPDGRCECVGRAWEMRVCWQSLRGCELGVSAVLVSLDLVCRLEVNALRGIGGRRIHAVWQL